MEIMTWFSIAAKIISWALRIAGLVLFICDAKLMKKEYDKENLLGVVYWGFMTVIVILALL